MKCADCRRAAAQNRSRCERCLARRREYRRRHGAGRRSLPATPRGDPNADYPCERLAYSHAEFVAACEATAPAAWALLYWQGVAILLGRPAGGVYRHARRVGAAAKIDKALR